MSNFELPIGLMALFGVVLEFCGFVVVWCHVQRLNKRVADAPRLAMKELSDEFGRRMRDLAQRAPRPPISVPDDPVVYFEILERQKERQLANTKLTAQTVGAALSQALAELGKSEAQARTDARESFIREWGGLILIAAGTLLQVPSLWSAL